MDELDKETFEALSLDDISKNSIEDIDANAGKTDEEIIPCSNDQCEDERTKDANESDDNVKSRKSESRLGAVKETQDAPVRIPKYRN